MAAVGLQSLQSATIAPELQAIWTAAVEQYEKSIKRKNTNFKGATNLDQLLTELRDSTSKLDKRRHDGSRVEKFRTLVRQSLTPIQLLGNIVAQGAKIAFPPSEAIFAAVSYLIQVAKSVSLGFDKISDFFEDLRSYLTRLKTLEGRIPTIPELPAALMDVFTSVLILCGVYSTYMTKNRFVIALRILRSGEDDELAAAYDCFHKAVRHEEGVVRNAILGGVQQVLIDVASLTHLAQDNFQGVNAAAHQTGALATQVTGIGKAIERHDQKLEREIILKWFSELEFHSKQRDTFTKHHQGTCQWFLDSDKFQDWFKNSRSTTLWCTGDPGVGKTVIVAKAVDYTEDNIQRPEVAIAYLYCDYKNPTTQSEIELLRSLIRQLVEQASSSVIPPSGKSLWEKFTQKKRLPSSEDWMSLLQTTCALFKRAYIFVDALDECAAATRGQFIHLLQRLRAFTHLMITSRPHLGLDKTWPDICRLDITAHPSDIKSYVEFQVDRNDRLAIFFETEPQLRVDIISKLTEKAAGMFLLVHLQLLQLCGEPSLAKVRKSLNSLPTGIHELYDGAFASIRNQSPHDADLALKALSYIACAKRPLAVQELCHALSVEAGDVELDRENIPPARILSHISAGLVHIDEESNTTALVHYTLLDYLKRNSADHLVQPGIEFGAACFTYVSLQIFACGPCTNETALTQRLRDYPFLRYASQYWGEHIKTSQQDRRLSGLRHFLKDEKKTASLLQILHMPHYQTKGWHDCFPKWSSPLHAAAYWGLENALLALVREGFQVNAQDSFGSTALLLAAKNGHNSAARCLIENGSDVRINNYQEESAIYWALRNGHQDVVELLLLKDCDALTEDSEGWTGLDWAIMNGFNSVAEAVLKWSSHNDEALLRKNKALILAAEAGNHEIVQTLLRYGAQHSWKDEQGSTALDWAVPEGHHHVVLALLNHQADVNSRDLYGNTPLHWSIPHQSITQLLLSHGAKIDARNDLGQTALLWSAQDGHEGAFELLLKNKADHDLQDKFGTTALHATALHGHETMTCLLLKRGADPDLEDTDGWTALHAAAVKHHKRIVHMLLSHKAQNGSQICSWVALRQQDVKKRALLDHISRRKSGGSTVVTGLRWVVGEGHVERLQTLLRAGVDIEAQDVSGYTALTIGAWMGQEDTVRLLLENGAEVDKRDRSGRCPLHVAAEEGYAGLVRLFVEYGANLEAEDCHSTALLLAARNGHTNVVKYILENGGNANAEDYHGRRALHWAAKHGTLAQPRLLTDQGAEVDATDRWGRTPLMWAVENTNFKVMNFLLGCGADFTAKAEDDSTALHLAAYIGSEEMLAKLLGKGAGVDTRTREGITALHISSLMGHESSVQILLANGADPGAKARWSRVYLSNNLSDRRNDSDNESSDWEDLADIFDDGGDDDASAYQPDSGENLHATPLISNWLRRRLLDLGIDVNGLPETNWDARKFAAYSGNNDVVRILVHT